MANATVHVPVHVIRGQALRDAGLEFCWMTLSGERTVQTVDKCWPLSLFKFDPAATECANEKLPLASV